MLGCIHHVQWLLASAERQWRCNNCKAIVTRREVYPKFEELGPDFAARWEAHEKGEPLPPQFDATTTRGGLTEL